MQEQNIQVLIIMRSIPLKDIKVTIRMDETMNNHILDVAAEEDSPVAQIVRKLLKEALIARGKNFEKKK